MDSLMRAKSLPTNGLKSNEAILNYNIDQSNKNSTLTGRKVIEILSATADYISPMYTGPKELVKSLARPDYWQPDELCVSCSVCSASFCSRRAIHHCRACGEGVCSACSRHYQPVPTRGLDFPARVCDNCFQSNSRTFRTELLPVLPSSSAPIADTLGVLASEKSYIYNNNKVNTSHRHPNCLLDSGGGAEIERKKKHTH